MFCFRLTSFSDVLSRHVILSLSRLPLFDSHYLDSDDDFRSGCRNVSHHYRQQSFSGLHSPGRSNYTITCYPRVQTIYCKAPTMFAPRSRTIKNPYGASLNDKYKKNAKLKQTHSFKHFNKTLENHRELSFITSLKV